MPANSRIKRAEFCPERLTLARKAKLWTMTRLADEIGLTRQAISQFERGEAKPSPVNLRAISDALDQPVNYFTWNIFPEKQSPATFRSLASSAGKARDQAEVWLSTFASIAQVLQQHVNIPNVSLPEINIPDFTRLTKGDIEEISISTRRHFQLGNGPLSNLTLLLENHGILIAFKKLNKGLSGLSQWYAGRPFVLIDPGRSACRARYSLSHELGHIILHQQLTTDDEIFDKETFKLIEDQANYFGSAFMLPESSLASEVYGTDWEALIELKDRWKMSIAALAMRLSEIDIISDYQKTRIFRELGFRNARVHEPLDSVIKQDYPRMFTRIMEVLEDGSVMNISDLPNVVPISNSLISDLTQIPEESLLQNRMAPNVISLKR
ncbi:MAG: XRE family transcriptional regulator [Candidatus Thiodiazotropha endolucinida]